MQSGSRFNTPLSASYAKIPGNMRIYAIISENKRCEFLIGLAFRVRRAITVQQFNVLTLKRSTAASLHIRFNCQRTIARPGNPARTRDAK
jgi:hypothetical protein